MVDFTRRKVFAADDWGFSPGINDGILELAKRGWLASVSCVANAKFLMHGLKDLIECMKYGMKFSLHLNLTYGQPLLGYQKVPSLCAGSGFASHRELMWRCLLGKLKRGEIAGEFKAQMSRLREVGIPVTSLDGHHHIHLLPCVARSLDDALVREGITEIRVLNDPSHFFSWLQTQYFKAFILRKGPALVDCHYLRPRHLQTVHGFRRKLGKAAGRPVLVHPALYNDFLASDMMDELRDYRVHELKTILKYLNE